MKSKILAVLLVVVGFLISVVARAETIASFVSDFQQDEPATGWKYLWNADGEIGAVKSYKPLVWNGTASGYAVKEDEYPLESSAGGYAVLRSGGGHPGRGLGQGEKNVDRYVIAAFTVPAGKSGKLSIADSAVRRPLKSDDGEKEPGAKIELRVYLNDTLVHKQVLESKDDPTAFDVKIGDVKGGDTVYIAVGPNEHDGWDTFELDFSLNLVK